MLVTREPEPFHSVECVLSAALFVLTSKRDIRGHIRSVIAQTLLCRKANSNIKKKNEYTEKVYVQIRYLGPRETLSSSGIRKEQWWGVGEEAGSFGLRRSRMKPQGT